jgi:radical SAM superfamily enzyme YgiQ (UPF0313 family)
MKIALVFFRSTFLIDPMVYPPLGLWYLAAQLEAMGHETVFYDLSVDTLPSDYHYDQIWFSATSPQMGEVKKVGEVIANYRTKTVLGGPAPWTNHLSCLDLGYDLVVAGEADHPEAIVRILQHKGYLNVGVQSGIDHVLPPIRRWSRRYHAYLEGPDGVRYRTATMFTSRGCPMACAFCESGRNGTIWSRFVRYEPLRVVETQLDEIKKLGFGGVQFYDDILPLNKARMLEILYMLKRYDLKWRCFIRTDIICKQGGYDYLKEMRDAGLIEVLAGVESASNRIKDNIQKGTTIEQDTQVLEWCKDLGVAFKASFILGLPGDDYDSLNATRKWILANRPDRADINILVPFPGTPLTERIEEYDCYITARLPEEYWYKGPRDDSVAIVGTSSLTPEEIKKFRDNLVREIEELGIPY